MNSRATLLLLLIAVAGQTQMARSQPSCSTELSNLNSCAPYVMPGTQDTNPGTECCNALTGVDQNCLCSTIRIAARLPTQCMSRRKSGGSETDME
ncbi:hypothetical protein HHK36_027794 [Tetracentron sinense]|uniref:Bifunctional inhibitor/plant lipid transfer protein/seed storage helical domain-containing protein n=1 Tax=Tetracentron sinense TaxID=13715 RepID=A0A834YI44_TETSI|nr:hypothetical protein HHK36_027794 [Tetracentron sinense]